MPLYSQEIDLSNITHANSSIPLSATTISYVNIPIEIGNPFYGNKKYPSSLSSVAHLSSTAQTLIKNLPVTTFYTSDITVANVATGYLRLSSTGTVNISALQNGKALNGNIFCLSSISVATIQVNTLYKNSNW